MQKQNSQNTEKKTQASLKKPQVIDKQFYSELLSFQYDKEDDEDYTVSCRPKIRSKKLSRAQKQQRQGLYLRAKFRFITSMDQVTDTSVFSPMSQLPWDKVTQVLFPRSEGTVTCPICMNEENQIVAPQITPCGHIFCWHCYLRHEDICDTKFYCPVCSEYAPQLELKSAKLMERSTQLDAMTTFQLLIRQADSPILYNAETYQEDPRFSKILIARTSYILSEILKKEKDQLEEFMRECISCGEDWNLPYIEQALEKNGKKIEKAEKLLIDELALQTVEETKKLKKKKQSKGEDTEICQPEDINFILSSLNNIQGLKKADLSYFYQEVSGSLVFLNPINYKYLLSDKLAPSALPSTITSKLIAEQNACVDPNFFKRQPYLRHLPPFSDVLFAEIDMKDLLTPETVVRNNNELELIHKKLKEKEERETKKMLKNRKPSEDPYSMFFDREYCLMNGLITLPPQNLKIEEKHYPSLEQGSKQSSDINEEEKNQKENHDSDGDDYVIVSNSGQLPSNYVDKQARQKNRELRDESLFPSLDGKPKNLPALPTEVEKTKDTQVPLSTNIQEEADKKVNLELEKQNGRAIIDVENNIIIDGQGFYDEWSQQEILNLSVKKSTSDQQGSQKQQQPQANSKNKKQKKKVALDGNFFF